MNVETRNLPLQGRAAEIRSFDESKRTFDLVWSTGAKVRRYDWRYERMYDEELSLDPSHVRMERLASGRAPLLDDHNRWEGVRSALGVVTNAQIGAGEGTATIKFSKRGDVADIMEDVKDGIVTSISVGYRVHRTEMLPPKKEGDVWVYRAVDWEPYELSLTPIPAETGANVRSDKGDENRSFPCEFIKPADSSAITQEHPMIRSFASTLGVKVEKDADDAAVRSAVVAHLGMKAESTDDEIVAEAVRRAAAPAVPGAPVDDVAKAATEAQAAERKRTAEIITFCAKHNASAEFQARAISDGWGVERTGLEILNERHAKGASLGPSNTNTPGEQSEQRSAGTWDHAISKVTGGK